jgi:hypothetical protein
MNLAGTELPEEIVATLRGLNIRDVETLLSMIASPAGLMAIARVLNRSEEEVRLLERRLAESFPEIEVVPAGGDRYPMGHVPTRR